MRLLQPEAFSVVQDRQRAPQVCGTTEGNRKVTTLRRADDPLYETPSHRGTAQSNMEWHIEQVLDYLGLDPDSQHFVGTPERFISVLQAYTQVIDLNALLKDGFADDDPVVDQTKKSQVVQTAIPFMGLCAHHLLPFFGAAAVGYLPRDRVVGLSKLARLVYAAGHLAPTTQEHITFLIAETLFNQEGIIKPRGVAVVTSALHGCMAVRGTETPTTQTVVTEIRGVYEDNVGLENKFMTIAMKGL